MQVAPQSNDGRPLEDGPQSRPSKHQRVLACTLCQQRKVKCDRRLPCANCVKSRTQCVPATLAPRRRRRYPERALLDRLRSYEALLRKNDIPFDSLQPAQGKDSPDTIVGDDSHDEQVAEVASELSTSSITKENKVGYQAKSVYHYMNKPFRDPDQESDSSQDDLREMAVKIAWKQEVGDDHHLLFGPFQSTISLYTLHPDPVQIFRLWQIYMNNVNPLLKVTHIPTLQARVIEAASNVTNIDPSLEALMFSMYCTAVVTITSEECLIAFGSSKEELLSKYRLGCQQALWCCRFLQTNDRDCLTALFLYLISVRPSVDPQSLSPMLGIAIRIAHRMGIHSEFALRECTPFEAEMRRRLWWSLAFFDTRMAELGNSRIVTLDPTWDCKVPLNVSDADLRPEMKSRPTPRKEPTDAIFAVVRSELGDHIRHTSFHLDFANPALVPIAKYGFPSADHLAKLEQSIEDRYLRSCDQENPLHFMVIWTIRSQLSKYQLMVHNARSSNSPVQTNEVDFDAATGSAIRFLECNTKMMTSPMIKGFVWLNQMYFPFPGYYQIAQDLKRRPSFEHAQKAWDAASDNWDAWFNVHIGSDSPIFLLLPKIILQAWEAYEASPQPPGQTLNTPRIVLSIKETLARIAENERRNKDVGLVNPSTDLGASGGPLSMSTPAAFANHTLPFDHLWTESGMSSATDPSAQFPLDTYMNQMDWTVFGGQSGW